MAVVDILKFIITGDNSGLKNAAAEADAAIGVMSKGVAAGLSQLAFRFAGLAAGAFALSAAMRNTVGEAVESERVYKQLGAAIEAGRENWRRMESRVRETTAELQKFSVFTDEEIAGAMKILIQSGMDSAQAISLLQTAVDAASATGMELAEVARVLGSAFQGSARGARQLGIVLDETGDKSKILATLVDEMNSRFRGRAATDLDTVAGSWANLGKQFKEVGERIGSVLLPPLQQLLKLLNALSDLFDANKADDFWRRLFGLETSEQKMARIKAEGLAQLKAEIAELERLGKAKEAADKRAFFADFLAPPKPPPEPIKKASKNVQEAAARERLAIHRKMLEELSELEDENARRTVEAQTDALNKIIEAEQSRFAFRRQMGEDTFKEEIAFLEEIKKSAEAAGLFDIADEAAKKIIAVNQAAAIQNRNLWELQFRALLNNAHRLASEFGRFMSEAVENFLHTALSAIVEIKDSLALLKQGGLGVVAGGVGIFGTVFGVVGSFIDMFSSGAEKINRSNLEVVRGIRDWINNLRGQTKAELGATAADIQNVLKLLASGNQFTVMTGQATARVLEGFLDIADLFKQRFGRAGTEKEVLNFWLDMIKEQGSTFGIILEGLKSVEEVRQFLKKQAGLDAARGRRFIQFFAEQNKFTPQQQAELLEALLAQLQTSGNITEGDLLSILEEIRQLREFQESTEDILQEQRQIQITRSVASITENQANLVVGFLQTIAAATQRIIELMEAAIGAAGAATTGMGGGCFVFNAGAIVINAGAGANGTALAQEFQTALRAKGVKV